MINPSEGRVKQDTDSALCNTAQRERERKGESNAGGGESIKSVPLHVLNSLALSLPPCLSHAQAMCGCHVTCRCRRHRGEREREEEKGREGLEEERERGRQRESGGK